MVLLIGANFHVLSGILEAIVLFKVISLASEIFFLFGYSSILSALSLVPHIGANLFHILGAIPDAVVLLVSGLTVSTETAQSKVSIGVGLLVGSTVFYLTVVWGLCVYAGKCDLEGKESQDTTDTKKFNLLGSGEITEIWTTYAARIKVISIMPFVVSQLPQVLHLSSGGQDLTILIALIVSVILTIAYFFYEFYCEPLIQTSRINYVEHKQVMLFKTLDTNVSGFVSPDEIRTLVIKTQSAETGSSRNHDHLDNIMKVFDRSGDKCIDVTEFIKHISVWLNKAKRPKNAFHEPGRCSFKYSFKGMQKVINQEHYMLVSDKNKREEVVKNPKWISFNAAVMLLGTSLAILVAEPLIDAVDDFSEATSIPTFFVSFMVLPLATRCSETLSAIKMARQKTQKTVSSTLSELSVTVTLNNLLCLSVFLAIVYIRGLYWDFGSEVLVLVIVCIVMGALTSFRAILPLWTSVLAVLLYPLSFALVYILHSIFGWS
ncbi:hypothetical protein ACLB2K_028885 [Fragaria x ananassa]